MNDEIIVTDAPENSPATTNEQEPEKRFIISGETWYEQDGYPWEEEVTFIRRVGDVTVEMPVRWYDLLDGEDPAPCLEVFGRAWPILINHCQDILAFLAEHPEGLTPQAFCEKLAALGYEDTTPRESPFTLKVHLDRQPGCLLGGDPIL